MASSVSREDDPNPDTVIGYMELSSPLGLRTVSWKKNFSKVGASSLKFSFVLCAMNNIFRDS